MAATGYSSESLIICPQYFPSKEIYIASAFWLQLTSGLVEYTLFSWRTYLVGGGEHATKMEIRSLALTTILYCCAVYLCKPHRTH